MTKWIMTKRQYRGFFVLMIVATVYAFIFSRTNRMIFIVNNIFDRYTEKNVHKPTIPTLETSNPDSPYDVTHRKNISGSLSEDETLDENYTDGTVVSNWDDTQDGMDEHSSNRDSSKIDVEGTVVVVTGKYGYDDMFQNEVEQTCASIREMSHFDPNHVFCYYQSPDYVLQDKRFVRHLQYRIDPNDDSARGGGYWCHKSLVLRHKMREYKDGDYFVYIDADRTDFLQQDHIRNIIETMAKRDADLTIELQIGYTEILYTKEDILHAFNVSNEMLHSQQVAANGFVIRNSPKMRKLMDAWADCVSDYHMVSDEPSILPNSEFFLTNIHDQSILGLLIKTFMTKQDMVGPPTIRFRYEDAYYTWQLDNMDALHCPFPKQ